MHNTNIVEKLCKDKWKWKISFYNDLSNVIILEEIYNEWYEA